MPPRTRAFGSGASLLITALLLAAPDAGAQLYRWVDEAGNVHMSDDLSRVPDAIRGEVEQQATRSAAEAEVQKRADEAAAREASAPPPAAPQPGAPQPEPVPPQPRRHVIAVQRAGLELGVTAVLDGRLNAHFKVDTGATLNTIPRAVVNDLGIEIEEDTPMTIVAGISGEPMMVPIVTLREVRLGSAVVENVDAAVLDTMPYGLLGMPFFNHFRTSVDPVHGRLTLEEIDLDGIEGIYGGYDRGYWVGRFAMIRMTLERIDWYRAQIPEEFTEFVGRLEEVEQYWLAQYEDLELRASQAGVPRAWRE